MRFICAEEVSVTERGDDILVRNSDLHFELVQFGIVERFPPIALDGGVGGLRDFPAIRFLVSRRSLGFGNLIMWREVAANREQREYHAKT